MTRLDREERARAASHSPTDDALSGDAAIQQMMQMGG